MDFWKSFVSDDMDGAASTIAVLSFALNSIKVIYNTVSTIKNAPQKLQQMTSNLGHLSFTLERLKGRGGDWGLVEGLPLLISECAKNLENFERKLNKLSSLSDNRAKRLWNNVKTMLQDEDLNQMSSFVQQYASLLSLKMDSLIEYVCFHEISQQDLTYNIPYRKGMSSHTISLERIEVQLDKNISLGVANFSTLQSIKAGTDQICDSVHAYDQRLNSLNDKVANLAQNLPQSDTGLSGDEWTTLKEIIGMMKDKYIGNPHQSANISSQEALTDLNHLETRKRNCGHMDDEDLLDDDLQGAYSRLCRLTVEKENTVISAETASVLSDIKQMLVSTLRAKEGNGYVKINDNPRLSIQNSSEDDQDLRFDDEAGQLKNLLNVSHRVAINKKGFHMCCVT